MSKKLIDVSSYQGTIDWKKVKDSGIEGAILKIIRKDLNPDNQFGNNWAGCTLYGVPVIGVYNYTYATTVSKAISDAKKVIQILDGRKVKVWFDVEDSTLTKLGKTLIDIINAYQKVIEEAGLEFGVYTGLYFYNTYLKPYAGQINCDFWIARYPSSAKMIVSTNPSATYQPVIQHKMEGWQYSSKGSVPGISGNVDLNLWYEEITGSNNGQAVVRNPYSYPARCLYKKLILMTGDDVKWLQWHLVRLGFLPALNSKGVTNIDGKFGPATHDAVIISQKHFKIEVDGKVGAVTRGKLESI